MKTRAAVLYEINKPLMIEEVEIPKLKRGQVLVKILATGVCRAQYNETIGLKGPDKFLPHLLGHEASAVVEDIGEGVKKVKIGDYVVASWIKGKGIEAGATQYKLGKKIINAGSITTFSEYSVISENRLNKISKQVPNGIASILGCAVTTGIGILRHTLAAKPGKSLAIFGIGGIGSSIIVGAKLIGLNPIIAVDISKDKLEYAKKLGATQTLLFNTARELLTNIDYAVEASGSKAAMEKAFEVINDNGTTVIAGNIRKGEKICIIPFDLIKGKRIIGTWGGETKPDEDIPYYATEYLSGRLNLNKLITQKLKLTQVNEGLKLMEENRVLGRMIIEFN